MTKRVMIFCVLLVAASAVAVAFFGLDVDVERCLTSGTGDVVCFATSENGLGSLQYSWTWDGPGYAHPSTGDRAYVSRCFDGGAWVTVSIVDPGTGATGTSAPYFVECDSSCNYLHPEWPYCDLHPPICNYLHPNWPRCAGLVSP